MKTEIKYKNIKTKTEHGGLRGAALCSVFFVGEVNAMNGKVILGIDVGTTGLRAGFYRADGTEVGFAVYKLETARPHPSRAEQNPEDWMTAMRDTVRQAMERYSIAPEQVAALSTASTCCSVVVCKKDGTPLRPCILWMDVRAGEQAQRIAEMTGEHLSAEWMPCKMLWLKENEPQVFSDADVICECQDWLTYRLTGLWSVNVNTACNWGYNADEKGFPAWFYKKLGLEDGMAKFPAEHCYRVGDPIAPLCPEAAEMLGLTEKTLVAQGGIDSSVGILGMGVCESGHVALMTGSSNLAMLLTKTQMFGESTINAGPDHLIPGYYTSFRGQLSSNSIIEWYRREICEAGDDPGFFDRMETQAAKLPAGSEGLVVLDYWQGNRHPYYDADVRGMIYGLSLHHTRAHLYRAILEGICYGTDNLLEQFRKAGFPVRDVHIAGGTTNSRLFLQIQADVSNVRIHLPKDCQSVCMGAAIAAAVAVEIYPDLPAAVRGMVDFTDVIEPNSERHKIYHRIFEQYRSLYPQLKDWMHTTTRVTGGL